MNRSLKYLKKGSVARFRKFYNEIVKKPLAPERREELLEIFQKINKTKKSEKQKNRLVAKSTSDLGI